MLELRRASYTIDGKTLVAEVDLHVSSGVIVGLVGPNGAGKSTLLRLAGGLLRPSSGEVLLDGAPIASLAPRALAMRRAMVLPTLAWPDGMCVLDAVLLGASPRLGSFGITSDSDRVAAMASLAALGADSLAMRDIATLSLGERQRVQLAMALQQQAPLLLLDEPTSAQDFGGIARIAELLRAHAAGGGAVLIALHDINLALRLCDSVALLDGGRFLSASTPQELVESRRLHDVYGDNIVVESSATGPVVLPGLRRHLQAE